MTERRQLELEWGERDGRTCLRVLGWGAAELRDLGGLSAAELGRRLALLPSELVASRASLSALQPVVGSFERDDEEVRFVPRFPFRAGTSYSLIVSSAAGEPEVWPIQRPDRPGAPAANVVAIYPSGDEVPLNLLKLYVYFSAPMSEGWALRSAHVRRADDDKPLEDVFLPMEPELWDRERRRLTLLLDPGRIKRGLAKHEDAGYPLVEGVPIVVSIDAAFRDGTGQPLQTGCERRYRVGAPVRARVEPKRWDYSAPSAGSREPLTVGFDRPLDRALLDHALWVSDRAGSPLGGHVSIGDGERCWRFEPESPWAEGPHRLIIEPILEDLAGNSVARVFDRDLTRPEDGPLASAQRWIDFTCAS